MSEFNVAIQAVIIHEGTSFTDDPTDHGGATKYGLTLKFLQENVDKNMSLQDLEDMTLDHAESIYKTFWWDKYNIGQVNNQAIASKVLDTFVNLGPGHATRIIQKSINDAGLLTHIDGIFGPIVIAQLNGHKGLIILANIKDNLVHFYTSIVAANPSQGKFLKGWLNRANE